ncbi:hypothetical protein O181_035803 [Austropuccinia psidii MF-1]|uniref:Uncharacterized protein n=1 Tax=Austropuccinia psidii MF-1 TaxID=1389203 RepID=A0A9Q3H8K8_9BASI|nr:hypothetical protein [Austropuccinia psidii MF-1]
MFYSPINRDAYISDGLYGEEAEVAKGPYGNPPISSSYQPLSRKNQNLVVTHSPQFTKPRTSPVPPFARRPYSILSTPIPLPMPSPTKTSPIPASTKLQHVSSTSSNHRVEGSPLKFPHAQVFQIERMFSCKNYQGGFKCWK